MQLWVCLHLLKCVEMCFISCVWLYKAECVFDLTHTHTQPLHPCANAACNAWFERKVSPQSMSHDTEASELIFV